jgi:hypothetical protein
VSLDKPAQEAFAKLQQARNLVRQTNNVRGMQSAATCDVTVVVRVRPLSEAEKRNCDKGKECRAVSTRRATIRLLANAQGSSPMDDTTGVHTDIDGSNLGDVYTFDAVLSEKCTTEAAFEWTGALAVSEVTRGVNAIVFALGQTGSGKTYTLLGETVTGSRREESVDASAQHDCSKTAEQNNIDVGMESAKGGEESNKCSEKHLKPGISSMTLECLLQGLKQRAISENGAKNDIVRYDIEVSAVQIYLNQVSDLLTADTRALHIRTRSREETYSELRGQVCCLHPRETYIRCKNVKEFESVLQRAVAWREQSSTHMNATSSRSHLVLTLAVKRTVTLSA